MSLDLDQDPYISEEASNFFLGMWIWVRIQILPRLWTVSVSDLNPLMHPAPQKAKT